MKFVYIDESGTGNEPIACMVGIITDAYRMRPTKSDWGKMLNQLSQIIGENVSEIHTKDFYSGNGKWRELDGDKRTKIIDIVFNWIKDRKHQIVFTSVDKTKFNNDLNNNTKLKEIGSLWKFMALHIVLSLQKQHQVQKKNKGNFLLIFDRKDNEQAEFTNLILYPPDWTNTYYNKKQKQEKISELIDVPHFVDSKQVPLIQLADFVSFFLRRHIELELNLSKEKYNNEKQKIKEWINLAKENFIPINNIYPKRGRCDCADLFYSYAPDIIKTDFATHDRPKKG